MSRLYGRILSGLIEKYSNLEEEEEQSGTGRLQTTYSLKQVIEEEMAKN